jgi:TRAP-type C4-dicarboxylate transport system substrate-binding protein
MSGSSKWKMVAAVAIIVAAALAFYLLRGGPAPEQTAGDGGKIVWKYSVWGPPRAFTAGIEKSKELFEAAGKGNFELQIGYGGALAPEKEHLDSIKSGIIDGAHVCIGYGPAKTPLAQVIELPFLLTDDMRVNARVVDAIMQHPLIEEELRARWNAKYLTPAVLSPYEFMGNRRIAHVGDLKGVRVRISGANATVLEKFGSVPTMVTAPETYTALERGTIDVVGFPWTDSFGAYRLYEVSKFATVGLSMSGFGCFSAVSIDSWNRFPEDLKALLPDVREQVIQAYFKAYDEGDQHWLPIFKEKLEIVKFPPEERAKMVEASKPLWDQWAADQDKEGHGGTEILNFAQEQIAKLSASR